MTTKIDILKEVIEKGSKNQTLMVLDNLIETLDEFLAREITEPAVITELHEMLIEHLGVQPRAMKLKNRVPARMRRALLFLQAMRNAVNKVED
jgi:hypothetical protein